MGKSISQELKNLKLDEYNKKKELERYTSRMAFLLKGEMGQDIKDVTSGKVKVKLTLKEKLKYKFKNIFNHF